MTEIDIDSVYKEITGKDWSYQFDRYIASNFAERIAQIARQPLLERIAELEQALSEWHGIANGERKALEGK